VFCDWTIDTFAGACATQSRNAASIDLSLHFSLCVQQLDNRLTFMELDGGGFYQNVPFYFGLGHDLLRITGTCITLYSRNCVS